MDGWTDGRMDERVDGWIPGIVHVAPIIAYHHVRCSTRALTNTHARACAHRVFVASDTAAPNAKRKIRVPPQINFKRYITYGYVYISVLR